MIHLGKRKKWSVDWMQVEGQYVFACGFQQNAERRLAFNRLAGQVFGLDFEPWYQRRFWTDKYIPFTLFDGDVAVANASVNRFTLVINGQRHRAVQFGTVMTLPDYRGQGLASQLIRQAMEAFRPECDLFYLMGDKDALGFYRKLGFEAIPQTSYRLQAPAMQRGEAVIAKPVVAPKWCEPAAGTGRWLNVESLEDCRLLLDLARGREPVSQRIGVLDAGHLLTFYAMNGYGDKLWYIPSGADSGPSSGASDPGIPTTGWLVIFEEEAGVLQLHDILFQEPIVLSELLSFLPHGQLAAVTFGFTPDQMGIRSEDGDLQSVPLEAEDAFFAIPADSFGTGPFLYPPIGLA